MNFQLSTFNFQHYKHSTFNFQLITYSLFFLFLSSCNDKRPDGVLDQETYKNVMKDIIMADVVKHELRKNDSIPLQTLAMVYKKYDVDSVSLQKTTDYYAEHPKVLVKLLQEIKDEFQKKVDSLKQKKPNKSNKKLPISDKIKLPKSLLKKVRDSSGKK